MNRIMRTPDIKKAIEIYYSRPEICIADIMDLWECSRSTASKLKTKAMEKMVEKNEVCLMQHTVLTTTAYEAWGIDIDDYVNRLTTLHKLQKLGVGDAEPKARKQKSASKNCDQFTPDITFEISDKVVDANVIMSAV